MGETLAMSQLFAYLPARKAGLDGTLVNPVRSGTKQPHASPCRVKFSLPPLYVCASLPVNPMRVLRLNF